MSFDAYLATNKLNGKKYVGITKKVLAVRWQAHKNAGKRGSLFAFHAALRKYGIEAFEFEHIACAETWADLKAIEILLIAQYDSLVPGGYNMTKGGEGALGYKLTPEQLERLSIAHMGQERTEETRRKIGIAAAGRRHTEESRAKMSAIQSERFSDPDVRAKHAAPLIEFMRSEAGKAHARAILNKILADPEKAARWNAGVLKGRGPKSPAARAKMSAGHIRHFTEHPEAKEKLGKLTRAQVSEIRWRLLQGEKQTELAKEYGVRQTNISMIATWQTWKDIPATEPVADAAD